MIKGVKPRTHLILDLCQFGLLVILATTALLSHTEPVGSTHTGWMLSRLHELAGIALCVAVGLHLVLHLPWIEAQLKRLFRST